MIDWHTHILPAVDDGSKDISESVALLKMLADQEVDTVVATPHFHANENSVEAFLERRNAAVETLLSKLPSEAPKILLGAEVKYYAGISRLAELKKLTISDSSVLLIEMPFSKWTEYIVRELIELSGSGNLILALAHIERYLKFQDDNTWRRLYESGIQMQVNASFFTDFITRRKALSMLRDNAIHLIGSDCHNINSRPPNIGNAYKIIEKKFSKDFVYKINEYGKSLLI